MLSKGLSSVLLLSPLIAALPAQLARRQEDPAAEWNYCYRHLNGLTDYDWTVHILGADHLSNYGTGSSTFGGGLLDNLRGRCGEIFNWGTNNDENAPDLYAYFTTPLSCTAYDISQAIQAANGLGIRVDCVSDGQSKDPNDQNEIPPPTIPVGGPNNNGGGNGGGNGGPDGPTDAGQNAPGGGSGDSDPSHEGPVDSSDGGGWTDPA